MEDFDFEKALELYEAGDPSLPNNAEYDKALLILSELIERGEQLESACGVRWHICFLREDFKGALEDLNLSLSRCVENANTLYNRGTVHVRLGNFQKALGDFEAAMRIGEKNGDDALIDAAEHYVSELHKRQS